MRTIALAMAVIVCIAARASAELVAFQGFETSGSTWSFTPSPSPYNTDVSTPDTISAMTADVWDDIAAFDFSTTTDIFPDSGSRFWGMQDLDNTNGGGNFDHVLAFVSIDVSNYDDVTVSFAYNAIGWDDGDDLSYILTLDGSAGSEVLVLEGMDGGGVSTSGWETETIPIANSVSMISLQLVGNQNGDDYGGWDSVQINGTAVPEPAAVLFGGLLCSVIGTVAVGKRLFG